MWKKQLWWTLLSVNTPFPFDKLAVLILSVKYYLSCDKVFKAKALVVLILVFAVISVSFILNPNPNLLIFYPLLFSFLAIIASKVEIDLVMIQKALLLNILFGITAAFFATFGGIATIGSLSLLEKAMPFLYAPQGFSPTLQVYGTLCIVWLLIALDLNQKKKILFYVVLFSSVLTFNRATWVFLFLLLCVYYTRYAIILLFVSFSILFCSSDIYNILFSTATLSSRDELRVGAELSYWNSPDFFIHLWGRGTHLTSAEIAKWTLWGRQYIENGWDFIFHTYGILGFCIYNFFVFSLLYTIYKRRSYKLLLPVLYYYFIEQRFTNEFLASSFCFFTLSILLLSRQNSDNVLTVK